MLVFAPAVIGSFLQSSDVISHEVVLGLWALGGMYFPMALLAVAMLDSISGVNPIVILPAIVRTFTPYLLVIFLLGVMWLVNAGGSALLHELSRGWRFALYLPCEFYSLYSLAASARLLGLLYYYNADRLGWLEA